MLRTGISAHCITFRDFYGVPRLTLMIGQGREAWRVADFAINFYANKRGC